MALRADQEEPVAAANCLAAARESGRLEVDARRKRELLG